MGTVFQKVVQIAAAPYRAIARLVFGAVRGSVTHGDLLREALEATRRGPPEPSYIKHVERIDDPVERFSVVARAVGASRMRQFEAASWRLFATWFLLFVAVTAVGAVEARSALAMFAVAGVASGCLARAAKWSFLNWQTRRRRLDGFGIWLKSGEWWPISGAGAAVMMIGIMGGLVALLTPESADAAISVANFTARSDIPGQALNALLPTGGNAFTAAVGQLANVLAGCAGFMVAYFTILGVAETAHTGKTMGGGKYHTMWAPIRVCIGMGMLVPALSGSITMAQQTVYTLAAFGSNTASDIFVGFLQSTMNGGNTGVPSTIDIGIPSPIGGQEVVRRILEMESCVAVQQQAIAEWGASATPLVDDDSPSQPAAPVLPDPAGTATTDGSATVWNYGRCGSIVQSIVPTGTTTTDAAAGAAHQYGVDRASAVTAVINAIRSSTIPTQIGAATTVGSESGSWPTAVAAPLVSAASAYETQAQQAAANFLKTQNASMYSTILSDAQTNGWPGMGAMWRTISAISGQVVSLAGQPPGFGMMNWDHADKGSAADTARSAVARLDAQWANETRFSAW